jgi:hypothetical protein
MHVLKIEVPFWTFKEADEARKKAEQDLHRAMDSLKQQALAQPCVKEAARIALGGGGYNQSKPRAEIENGRVVVYVSIDLTEEKAAEIAPPKPDPAMLPKPSLPRLNLDVSTLNLLLNGKLLNDAQKSRLILSQLGAAAEFIVNGEVEA